MSTVFEDFYCLPLFQDDFCCNVLPHFSLPSAKVQEAVSVFVEENKKK